MERGEFEKRYISVRRRAIELDFKHLNEIQREAVMTTCGPLLLLAGAGSGKTTVLINRIACLLRYGCGSDSDFVPDDVTEEDLSFLEEYIKNPDHEMRVKAQELCAVDPAEPWRIIAITFTNKAAGELKQRLERMLGVGSEDIWALTFHSACVKILRRDIDKLGYDRSFTIYDTSDSGSLMKRIIKEQELDDKSFPYRTLLGYISRAKDGMVSPEEFIAAAEKKNDIRKRLIGHAYREYSDRLKAANALDFDDLILLTVKLFREHQDVLEYYQKRFKYVLIDEYQDTNNLQYLLASALAGGHGNICVVGDDDQSIYKFRGATIENILSFEKRYKEARIIRLEQNYRSTGYILNAANDVIRNNKSRKGKKLWTENDTGEKPSVRIADDERGEAQFVADTVLTAVAEGKKFQDHAVLYRMNAQSNQLETAFKRAGVPYRIIGGTGFYDRAEIKDMLAYLCLINNPTDDLRLLRIINSPPRGIGQTTVSRLTELSSELGVSIFEAIAECGNNDDLKKSAAKLHQFREMIEDLRELSENAPLDEFYDALVSRTGYIRALREKETDENLARIENVNELKTNIVSFMRENGGGLFDFLNEIALYTDLDRYDQGSDCVVMMTMHSAKGLEFDTVFIVGAEEGIFPSSRAIGEQEEMEEERRLCYVAMTRAMRRLYFICAKRRTIFGKTTAGQTSRFIGEVNADNIDKAEQKSFYAGREYDFGGDFDFKQEVRRRESKPTVPAARPITGTGGSAKRIKPSISAPLNEKPEALPDFKKGDSVTHKAFGSGVIVSLTPAGGDALVEIAFNDTGTKRLMLKSAAKYMTKG